MARLKACLKELGWELVSEHAYGGEQPHQMMLQLLRNLRHREIREVGQLDQAALLVCIVL